MDKIIRKFLSNQFMKFFYGGIINYIIKIFLTWFLTETIQLWYLVSYTISLSLLVVFGFFYNAYITYEHTINKRTNFIKFSFFLILFIVADASLVGLSTEVIGFHYLISIILTTTILFPTKFFIYKRFVFKKKKIDQITGLLSPLLEMWRIKKAIPWIKGSVLDIGCGSGNLLKYLEKDVDYLGIDILEESIKKAREVYPNKKFIILKVGEGSELPVNKFDSIILLAVLEHLKKPSSLILKLKNNLKPRGRIILTTPLPFSDKILHFGSKLGLFSKEAFEEHENYFDKEKLVSLLEESGLKVVHYKKFELGLNQIVVGQI